MRSALGRLGQRLTGPGGLALACVAVLAVPFVVRAQFDPDFFWHVLVGDRILDGSLPRTDPFTFTATGHTFVVQEWGSEALFAMLTRAGVWLVVLVMGAVTWCGLWLCLLRARRHTGSPAVLAAFGAVALAVGVTVFGPRAQMFSFTLLALTMWLLDRHRHRRLGGREVWWLVAIFAIWGNLHGGFSLGLGLVAVVVVADAISIALRLDGAIATARLRTEAAALGLGALAVLLNPNGIGVYRYAAGLLSNPVAQANLDEWRSPSFHDPSFIPLAALIALLIIVGPRVRGCDLADALTAAAGVVLTLYAVRNLSTVIVTSTPLLAAGFDSVRAELESRRSSEPSGEPHLARGFVALVLAGVVAGAGVLAARNLVDARNDPRSSAYPVAVADELCSAPATRLLQPYGSAGWLLFVLERGHCPRDPLFVFGEVYVIGPTILQDYLDAVAARPGTASILDRYGVESVWQPQGGSLVQLLAGTPGWTCVWADDSDVIVTRSTGAGAWPGDRAHCPRAG